MRSAVPHRPCAGRIAGLYALLAAVWIAGSDYLVVVLEGQPYTPWPTLKGMAFVAVTASLLYMLLRRTERPLLASWSLYRAAARNFPKGAVILFDRDFRHILAEGAGLAEAGLSKDEARGQDAL